MKRLKDNQKIKAIAENGDVDILSWKELKELLWSFHADDEEFTNDFLAISVIWHSTWKHIMEIERSLIKNGVYSSEDIEFKLLNE
ncbi:MAG: hypothetical protein KGY70_16270 [Bacteroidales bacterium]|nr:hypothetical protein [Bacteroidales bacterium]